MCKKETKFEVGKTYKTRGNDSVKIIHMLNTKDRCKLVGIFIARGSVEEIDMTFTLDGSFDPNQTQNDYDLMPPMRTVWVNFYEDGKAFAHQTKDSAENEPYNHTICPNKRIATAIPVEIPE